MHCRFVSFPTLLSAFLSSLLLGPAAGSLRAEKPTKSEDKQKQEKITYEQHVKPIFRQKCFGCHNPDKKSGGLDLTTYTTLMEGGSSGEVIAPGSAEDSYLYRLVTHQSQPYMPLNSEKLPSDMLATIRKWIDGGVLATADSKPLIADKPKSDFSLESVSTGRPEGPPPMPGRLSLEPVVHTPRSAAVTALATSPWAPLVAVSGQKQVLLYHSETLDLLGVLPFPEGVPHALRFSRNGRLLLAGGGHAGDDGRVVVWNVKTGERVIEVGSEFDSVLAADINADQTLVALGGPGGVVRVYSTEDGQKVYQVKKHTDWIYAVQFSRDGVLMATADRNGGLHVWEAFTGREYLTLDGHDQAITGLSWRADSNVLASSSEDGRIHLWEMHEGRRIKRWTAHGGGASSVEFTRDGRLVSCGRDRRTKIWDGDGKQQRAFDAFSDITLETTFCDETGRVIAGDWTGAIRVWNGQDGKLIGELTSNPLTLNSRLESARETLSKRQAKHKQVAAAFQEVQTNVEKLNNDLKATSGKASKAEKRAEALTQIIAKAKQAAEQAESARKAASRKSEQLETALPLLEEASDKLGKATEKIAGDNGLSSLAKQLRKQLQEKRSALSSARQQAKDQTQKLVEAQQQLSTADKEKAELSKTLQELQKQIAKQKELLQAAEQKAAQLQEAAQAAAQAVEEAQAAVERWQDELAFARQKQNTQASLDQ